MLESITGFVNLLFSPVTVLYPPVAVAVLAAFFTALVFTLNRLIVKKDLLEDIKKRMEEIRENLTLAQQAKNLEAVEKWMKELVKVNNQYVKSTFKGLVIAIAVSVVVFPWVSSRYSGAVVELPFVLPMVGNSLTGIYWYIFVSFIVGWVINKLLGG
jgi:uncharacterized membrane protein (DUF106 family)